MKASKYVAGLLAGALAKPATMPTPIYESAPKLTIDGNIYTAQGMPKVTNINGMMYTLLGPPAETVLDGVDYVLPGTYMVPKGPEATPMPYGLNITNDDKYEHDLHLTDQYGQEMGIVVVTETMKRTYAAVPTTVMPPWAEYFPTNPPLPPKVISSVLAEYQKDPRYIPPGEVTGWRAMGTGWMGFGPSNYDEGCSEGAPYQCTNMAKHCCVTPNSECELNDRGHIEWFQCYGDMHLPARQGWSSDASRNGEWFDQWDFYYYGPAGLLCPHRPDIQTCRTTILRAELYCCVRGPLAPIPGSPEFAEQYREHGW